MHSQDFFILPRLIRDYKEFAAQTYGGPYLFFHTRTTSHLQVHFLAHGRVGGFIVEKPMVLGHESAGVVSKGRSIAYLG